MLFNVLLYVGLFIFFYLALCGLLFVIQRFLLYSPVASKDMPLGWTEVKNQQGGYLLGIFNKLMEEPSTQRQKAVVLFHGNRGNANSKIHYKKLFPEIEFFINEYPGFGFKKQLKPTSANISRHAREFIEQILIRYEPEDILLVGESFGTGVASMIAKEYGIRYLLLITPYTSLKAVAQDRFWYVPAKYLLKDDFNSIENLKNYEGNVLFIASEEDEIIPVKFAKTLYENTHTQTHYILVRKAKHKTWHLHMSRDQRLQFRQFINEFLKG